MGGAGETFHFYIRANAVVNVIGLREASIKPGVVVFTIGDDSLRKHFNVHLPLLKTRLEYSTLSPKLSFRRSKHQVFSRV